MVHFAWAVGSLLLLNACGLSAQTTQPVDYADTPEALATVQDERIVEASGIVASRVNAGCHYVHNDSGDLARVFLIDRAGRTRLVIQLKGIQSVDAEDIAIAPGAKAGTYDVCLADIGDNSATRHNVAIYRFAEVALPGQTTDAITVDATAYTLRYPDGPTNAEAFFVHPRTGDGYVLTKRLDGRPRLYKLAAPWDAKAETTLTPVKTIDLPPALPLARIVTAADISPDGLRVAVRCYLNGWEWRLPTDTPDKDFEHIFDSPLVGLALPPERQGEALCYAADGQALLTVSEGRNPILWELRAVTPTSQARR